MKHPPVETKNHFRFKLYSLSGRMWKIPCHYFLNIHGLCHLKHVTWNWQCYMKWHPPGSRKRGRPKRTWADGIRGLMGEMDW